MVMERGDRPWGYYLVLHEDAGYKVKQFVVRPGSRLSLQSHRRRAEHWQVVRGEAEVTCGKEIVRLLPGGIDRHPLGHPPSGRERREGKPRRHRGADGEYVGEDDIERFEDDYGRAATASAATLRK